jgi:type III secretion protein T
VAPSWLALSDQVLLLGLCSIRMAIACMLLPLFAGDLLPATVRNAMFIAFGLLALCLQPPIIHSQIMQINWLLLLGKEALIGTSLGFLFGAILWAFEAAGQIIDTKIGASSSQVTDPLSGQQTALNGAFLGRLANFIFMFSGGFLLLISLILDSYQLWPVLAPQPTLSASSLTLFTHEFGRLMGLTTRIAAPCLVVLFAIDGVLGLVNRFAPQLNVFSLSMSIKTWASAFVLMLTLGAVSEHLVTDIQSRPSIVLRAIQALLPLHRT